MLKGWASAVDDWVFSHMHVQPSRLGPIAVRQVARMTLEAELFTSLVEEGALGGLEGRDGPDAVWEVMMEHLWERLGCSKMNLRYGLSFLK